MNNKMIDYMKSTTVAQQFAYKVKDDSKKDMIRIYAPMILLVLMTVIAALSMDKFFSWKNLTNLMYQMSIPLVLSAGVTFVLLIGSIDLSVEGVMGFAGAAVAIFVGNAQNNNDFGIMAIIAVVIVGTLFGAITGFLHVKMRISSFIITFAMGSIATGFGVLTYNGIPTKVTDSMFESISRESFIGIPYITWIAFGIFILCGVILNYTAFGRAVYAIGDNETAARSTGINVDHTKIKVFALCACTASMGGVLACMRLKLGQVSIGSEQLFPVITSVLLGGASLAGGKGGMLQSFVGILIYTELVNWLTMIGVDPYYKKLIQGVIIIIAVVLTISRDRRTISK